MFPQHHSQVRHLKQNILQGQSLFVIYVCFTFKKLEPLFWRDKQLVKNNFDWGEYLQVQYMWMIVENGMLNSAEQISNIIYRNQNINLWSIFYIAKQSFFNLELQHIYYIYYIYSVTDPGSIFRIRTLSILLNKQHLGNKNGYKNMYSWKGRKACFLFLKIL